VEKVGFESGVKKSMTASLCVLIMIGGEHCKSKPIAVILCTLFHP